MESKRKERGIVCLLQADRDEGKRILEVEGPTARRARLCKTQENEKCLSGNEVSGVNEDLFSLANAIPEALT